MATIQPGGLLGGDKELGSVGILASISHGQPTSTIVLQLEVLILKLLTIDAPA